MQMLMLFPLGAVIMVDDDCLSPNLTLANNLVYCRFLVVEEHFLEAARHIVKAKKRADECVEALLALIARYLDARG